MEGVCLTMLSLSRQRRTSFTHMENVTSVILVHIDAFKVGARTECEGQFRLCDHLYHSFISDSDRNKWDL